MSRECFVSKNMHLLLVCVFSNSISVYSYCQETCQHYSVMETFVSMLLWSLV